MTQSIKTVSFLGASVIETEVQACAHPGIPSFTIVGMPSKMVLESRERIKAALCSVGIKLPPKRITVNLSPADLSKQGNHYDLPIAVSVMIAIGEIDKEFFSKYLLLGEIALDGEIKSVPHGLLASIYGLGRNLGIICSTETAKTAIASGNNKVIAFDHLSKLIVAVKTRSIEYYSGEIKLSPLYRTSDLCYRDVVGQIIGKRAALISAAGGHHMLILGPPGCGKSMIAARITTIMPPCTIEQMLDVTMMHSVFTQGIVINRPYRSPHHSISYAALIGGGPDSSPGEISLAHHGIIFLDELPEFNRMALEALRQPLEDKRIVISRANKKTQYDCDFTMIAASNLCKCGRTISATDTCRKFPKCSRDYLGKISKPLLERIDILVSLQAVREMSDSFLDSSRTMREQVLAARLLQKARNPGGILNSCLTIRQMDHRIPLGNRSMRNYVKIMRLARTIADLDNSENVKDDHIEEGIFWRTSTMMDPDSW